jgi:hypothetical protein
MRGKIWGGGGGRKRVIKTVIPVTFKVLSAVLIKINLLAPEFF